MSNKLTNSYIHNTTQYELSASTFRVEDTVRSILWNTDIQLPNYMVSQPTKLKYTWIWLIKDHVPHLETDGADGVCPKL